MENDVRKYLRYGFEFHKLYPNLPINERENVCCIIDNEPVSWKLAKMYIERNTEEGAKIIKELIAVGVI